MNTDTPPPLSLQEYTDLREHDFAQLPCLWHESRFANVTCAWSWTLCGINPAILKHHTIQINMEVVVRYYVHSLNHGTKRRECSVSFTFLPLYPRDRTCSVLQTGGPQGRSGLDVADHGKKYLPLTVIEPAFINRSVHGQAVTRCCWLSNPSSKSDVWNCE